MGGLTLAAHPAASRAVAASAIAAGRLLTLCNGACQCGAAERRRTCVGVLQLLPFSPLLLALRKGNNPHKFNTGTVIFAFVCVLLNEVLSFFSNVFFSLFFFQTASTYFLPFKHLVCLQKKLRPS